MTTSGAETFILAHNSLSVELGAKDGLLALGAYTVAVAVAGLNPYPGIPVKHAKDLSRICHIDIRTARRLWPSIEPLLKAS